MFEVPGSSTKKNGGGHRDNSTMVNGGAKALVRPGFEMHAMCDRTILQLIHRTHFPESERGASQASADYRRCLYGYLQSALKSDMTLTDALNFHYEAAYESRRAAHQDMSRTQIPGVIINSISSSDYSFMIFGEGAKVVDNGLVGGAFGTAYALYTEKQVSRTNFTVASSYMNNHMDANVPYEPTICSYGPLQAQEGMSEEKAISLGRLALNKYVQDWKSTGKCMVNTDAEVCYREWRDPRRAGEDGEPVLVRTYLPLLLHDTQECRYYVIHKSGGREPFEDWVKRVDLADRPEVQQHLKSLGEHAAEKGYFGELVSLTAERVRMRCADSRCCASGNNKKDLAALTTDKQKMAMLSDPTVRYISVALHFDCGYIKTTVALHELGAEIERRLQRGREGAHAHEVESTRRLFEDAVEKIFEGQGTGLDPAFFAQKIKQMGGGEPLPQAVVDTIHAMVGPVGEIRDTMRHMNERGVLVWSDGRLQMPAATVVEGVMEAGMDERHPRLRSGPNAAELRESFVREVTRQLYIEEANGWNRIIDGGRDDIVRRRVRAAQKLGLDEERARQIPSVKVEIENFGKDYRVVVSDGRHGIKDAVTGEPVDI